MQLYQFLILFIFSISSLQNEPEVMRIDDLFSIKLAKEVKLFPDGSGVLVVLSESEPKLDKRIQHLWKADIDGRSTVKITNFEQGESYPQFFGKDKIAFLALNKGKQNIYSVDYNGGNVKLLFNHNNSISAFTFSKNFGQIYFLSSESNNPAIKKGLISSFFKNDTSYLVSNLWEYDFMTGIEKKILSDSLHVRSMSLSPDGKNLVLSIAPTAQPNDDIHAEIYVMNLETHNLTRITNNNVTEESIAWSRDGNSLVFLCDANQNMEIYYQHNIFLVNLKDKKPKLLAGDIKYEINSIFFDRSGKGIYFSANMGARLNLFHVDINNGKWIQLTNDEAVMSKFYYDTRYDFMVCAISSPQKPDDIYKLDVNGKIIKRITSFNPDLIKLKLASAKAIRWKSSDGNYCEGILYYPVDYDSSKRYPLLVQLHGGPAGSYTLQFQSDYLSYDHVLAGRGYMILQPNYRGSTGYGDECMRSVIGHYFEKDVDDVIYGIKFLINAGLADSNRIGVHGWSAGGHLTNWLITHYNFFKAASSGAGMCDWLTFYNTTEVRYLREIWFKGKPNEKYNDYYNKSPVVYAKNAITPTLIICGLLDKRVPFGQSEEMYNALKSAGCVTELIPIPESGHGLWQLSKQKLKMEKELAWFSKYLK